ncbi:tyrosine-protein kinase RYK-like isoform X2 [Brevipalpus obovatus]|uniref:tyrosine-protein kinase RYK-like isoform X2 n=1 Tax=Brevipalpus obovatus TaxID=246614 RepID=UPI003D9DBCB5
MIMMLLLNICMIVCSNFFTSVDGSLNLYIDKYESEKFTESRHPIMYVDKGIPNNYSLGFPLYMYPKVPQLHFTWQRLTDMPISYAIALEFMDSMDAISTPLINISRTGNVPKKEQVFRVDVPCNGKRKDMLTFYVLINFTFHSDNTFIPLKLRRERMCDKGLNHTIPSEGMSFLAERPKNFSDDYSHFILIAIVLIAAISCIFTGISWCKCIIREPDSKLIYHGTVSRQSSRYEHSLSKFGGHVNKLAPSFSGCESPSPEYYSIPPSCATSRCTIPIIKPENLLDEEVEFKGDHGHISTAILHTDRDKMKVSVKYFCNEKSSEELSFLLDQASELHDLEHSNIHRIVAYCLDKSKLYLVYTDVDNLTIDLKYWLQNHPSFPHIYRQTRSIAHICAGMEYLHRNGIVHADIAARNCIVCSPHDPNEFVVKISDSTLARVRYPNDYQCCDDNQYLPIKWMAYECLLKVGEKCSDYVPNESSDIWALGVTIWEIINFGQEPYIDSPISRVDMISRLKRGLFLPPPSHSCLNEMYESIKLCWSLRPEQRPKASYLRKNVDLFVSYV